MYIIALCPKLGSIAEGRDYKIGLQYILLLSNRSNYYLELSTKLLSTKKYNPDYIEPSVL